MVINVAPDVEASILAAVKSGRFLSVDEAVATAWRELNKTPNAASPPQACDAGATPDPLLGIWRDYAEEMDTIVVDAMKRRKEEPWRVIPGE